MKELIVTISVIAVLVLFLMPDQEKPYMPQTKSNHAMKLKPVNMESEKIYSSLTGRQIGYKLPDGRRQAFGLVIPLPDLDDPSFTEKEIELIRNSVGEYKPGSVYILSYADVINLVTKNQ
jgi:hypothetical protein